MSQRTKIKALLTGELVGKDVTVKGWVRAFRQNRFIALNDGSTNNTLQIVVDFENTDAALLKRITVGAAISVTGVLVPSQGQGQTVELPAAKLEVLGDSDPEKYPIQPKKHSLEFLRENAHLRFRTNTFGAIFRVRNTLSFAVHQFLQEKGFVYLHTPIITKSDAEGAGEAFHVTNFDLNYIPFSDKKIDLAVKNYFNQLYSHIEKVNLKELYSIIDKHISKISLGEEIFGKRNISFKELICAEEFQLRQLIKYVDDFENVNPFITDLFLKLRESGFFKSTVTPVILERKGKRTKLNYRSTYLPDWFIKSINPSIESFTIGRPLSPLLFPFLQISPYNFNFTLKELKTSNTRELAYNYDFFGEPTNLTVSGQLEGELGAMALSDIYTFGPTFRAENSNTTRHLAEFWMIEPEMAFYDLKDNADLAEAMLKYVIQTALDKSKDDLEFLSQRLADEEKQKPQNERSEMSLLDKLQFCLDNDFERITYTEAISILRESSHNKKKKFQYLIEGWGADLQSEHERYLVEKHFKKPVVLTDYPKEIKSFYMRQNDDGKTVAAMDILFPGIGEIIGGSQREERLDRLEQRMDELGIPKDELWWYLDTRRFGTCPHAGFGLGFERLVLFVTGMGNIRDVIPFPRFPKNAEF
jgi:aspartyl/asparaginyl-tRNA synthetase